MELLTITQLYEKYPNIEDIANRLEISKAQAEKAYKERKEQKNKKSTTEEIPGGKTSRILKVPYEHARIFQYYTAGTWHETHFLFQPGKEVFEQNLMRIMARKPDAITIQLNNSSKVTSLTKPQTIEIVFNKDVQIPLQKNNEQENETVLKIQEQLNGLQEQIKNAPTVNANNVGESIEKLNFAQQLKDIQHTNTLENLKRDHRYEKDNIVREYEKQIDELNETIEDLEAEIEELEAERAETEDNLSGIEKTIAEAKNPSLLQLLGKIGSNVIETFAKENIAGVSKFLKVDEKELSEYFLGKEEAEKEKDKNKSSGNNANFEEATVVENEVYSNLDADKKEIADSFINVVNLVAVKDLKMLIAMLELALNDDGTLLMPVFEKMYKDGKELKTELKKQAENTNNN